MDNFSYEIQEEMYKEYRLGLNSKRISRKINRIFDDEILDIPTTDRWLRHYRAGNATFDTNPMDSDEFIDLNFWPDDEFLFDIFGFLNRNEVEKCQLVNKNFKFFIKDNADFLPHRLIQRLLIFIPENRVDIYLELPGTNVHHFNFGKNNFELKFLALALKFAVIQDLRLFKVTTEADGHALVDMLQKLVSYRKDPLRVVCASEIHIINPFYERIFRYNIYADIVNLDVGTYSELLKLFININSIYFWQFTKKVFIKGFNYQPYMYMVDILPQLFSTIKIPSRFGLVLYKIDDIQALNVLIGKYINIFNETEKPDKLLSEAMFMWIKTDTASFQSVLDNLISKNIVLNYNKPVTAKIKKQIRSLKNDVKFLKDVYGEIHGTIEKGDGWCLDVKIDSSKYAHSDKMPTEKVSFNIQIKVHKLVGVNLKNCHKPDFWSPDQLDMKKLGA